MSVQQQVNITEKVVIIPIGMGVGKELGMEGLVHNTELKSVFVSTER